MTFSTYHPVVNLIFFASVLLFGMLLMHPVFLGIALLTSAAYSIVLNGKGAARSHVLTLLPMLLLMAILNPLFQKEGATTLFVLLGQYLITMESMLYGASSACLFLTILFWFSCYQVLLTSDKLQFLFHRFSPSVSLIFSMTLRFIPRMKSQLLSISAGQRCIGRDVSSGNLLRRAKNGMHILSIMTTWALENAIDTADSMKSRGYGLSGRTFFSLYRFQRRDAVVMSLILICSAVMVSGMISDALSMEFYPRVQASPISTHYVACVVCYIILCTIPLTIEGLEVIAWKRSVSQI